jgi:hypothetical protein
MDEIRFIDSSELLRFNIGELASRLRIISNSRPRKNVCKLFCRFVDFCRFSDTIDCKFELLENNLIFPKRGYLFNNCTLCSQFPLIQEFCTEEEEVEDLIEYYTNSIKLHLIVQLLVYIHKVVCISARRLTQALCQLLLGKNEHFSSPLF